MWTVALLAVQARVWRPNGLQAAAIGGMNCVPHIFQLKSCAACKLLALGATTSGQAKAHDFRVKGEMKNHINPRIWGITAWAGGCAIYAGLSYISLT